MHVDLGTVILNFPRHSPVIDIEWLTVAGNGRVRAGGEIRRDGLQGHNFVVIVRIFCMLYRHFTEYLRICY